MFVEKGRWRAEIVALITVKQGEFWESILL